MTTANDIAKRAGVNQSTVSRVLSGHPSIPERTASKVMKACRELGYVPNAMARGLRSRRAYAIAVHIPFTARTVFIDPFVAMFLHGVRQEAGVRDYGVLLSYVDPDDLSVDLAAIVKSGRADGVIVASPHSNDERIGLLREEHVAAVLGRCEGQELGDRTAFVDIDNEHKGYLAGRFLLSRGHRRIGLINSDDDALAVRDFCDGFGRALAEGADDGPGRAIRLVPDHVQAGATAVEAWLAEDDAPTAIAAGTTLLSLGAHEAIRRPGAEAFLLSIGSPLLDELHPGAPRIIQPVEKLGQAMAAALIRVVEGEEAPPPRMLYSHVVDETVKVFEEPHV